MSWLELTSLGHDQRPGRKSLDPSIENNPVPPPVVSLHSRSHTTPSPIPKLDKDARPLNSKRMFFSRRQTSVDATMVARNRTSSSGDDDNSAHPQPHPKLPEIVHSEIVHSESSLVSRLSTKSSKSGDSIADKLAQGLRKLSKKKRSTGEREALSPAVDVKPQFTRYGGRGLRRIKMKLPPALETHAERHLERLESSVVIDIVPTKERCDNPTSRRYSMESEPRKEGAGRVWYEQRPAHTPSYLPLSFPVPRLQASSSTPALPLPYANTPLASPTSFSSSSHVDEAWSSSGIASASTLSLTLDKHGPENSLSEDENEDGVGKAEDVEAEGREPQEWRIRHPYAAALELQSGSNSNLSSPSLAFQTFRQRMSSNLPQSSRSSYSSVSSDYHSAILPPDGDEENPIPHETPIVAPRQPRRIRARLQPRHTLQLPTSPTPPHASSGVPVPPSNILSFSQVSNVQRNQSEGGLHTNMRSYECPHVVAGPVIASNLALSCPATFPSHGSECGGLLSPDNTTSEEILVLDDGSEHSTPGLTWSAALKGGENSSADGPGSVKTDETTGGSDTETTSATDSEYELENRWWPRWTADTGESGIDFSPPDCSEPSHRLCVSTHEAQIGEVESAVLVRLGDNEKQLHPDTLCLSAREETSASLAYEDIPDSNVLETASIFSLASPTTPSRALLTTLELISTEYNYLSSLQMLLTQGATLTPPPSLMVSYAKDLVRASEDFLWAVHEWVRDIEGDGDDGIINGYETGFGGQGITPEEDGEVSIRVVARAFLGVKDKIEVAMVKWCGVVGSFFVGPTDFRKSSLHGSRIGKRGADATTLGNSLPPISLRLGSPTRWSPTESAVPTHRTSTGRSNSTDGPDEGEHCNRTGRTKMGVRDLAILPTQRVMRYVLLFRDLVSQTPPTSLSHLLLEQALEAAHQIAQECDHAQRNAAFLI